MSFKKHTVILDASVIVYHTYDLLDSMAFWSDAFSHDKRQSILKALFCYVNSCDWLGQIQRGNWNPIWVLDRKRDGLYWRHEYLKNHSIEYKAGRTTKPDHWYNILGALTSLLDIGGGPWKSLSVLGFEADDMASLLVQSSPLGNYTTMATIDTDWMGLIDEGLVDWYSIWDFQKYGNAKNFIRHRFNMETINEWAMQRLKKTFNKPTDLWDYKAKYGDKSDNLPSNSPIEVIDLVKVPAKYNLIKTHKKIAKALIKSKSTVYERPEHALSYLAKYSIPIYPH